MNPTETTHDYHWQVHWSEHAPTPDRVPAPAGYAPDEGPEGAWFPFAVTPSPDYADACWRRRLRRVAAEVAEPLYVVEIRPEHRGGRGRYERPERMGYTDDLAEAGRFTRDDLPRNHFDGTNSTRDAVPAPTEAA